jgi:hypothetical protein
MSFYRSPDLSLGKDGMGKTEQTDKDRQRAKISHNRIEYDFTDC